MCQYVADSVNGSTTATNLSAAQSTTEDAPAFSLTDIVITDPDSGETVTATLTLSGSHALAGTMSTATVGATTSTFLEESSGVWVWRASGSVDDVNTLLAGVAFTMAADYDQDFEIDTSITTTSINSGVITTLTGTKAVSVTAINDLTTATNLSEPESFTEDATPVLYLANIGLKLTPSSFTEKIALYNAAVLPNDGFLQITL